MHTIPKLDTLGTLRVYETHRGIDLSQPRAAFDTDIVTALDWAPDEKSLATISISKEIRTPLGGEPIEVAVKVVPLEGGDQRTVGTLRLRAVPTELDLLGFKTLSWTQ